MTYVCVIITFRGKECYKMNTYIWLHFKEYSDHINSYLNYKDPLEMQYMQVGPCKTVFKTLLQNLHKGFPNPH
jgi:hypothetical protein